VRLRKRLILPLQPRLDRFLCGLLAVVDGDVERRGLRRRQQPREECLEKEKSCNCRQLDLSTELVVLVAPKRRVLG